MRALALLLLASCTAAPPTGSRGQEIVNGTPTTDFPATVAVAYADAHSRDVIYCSGTVVGPRIILTAAHCIIDNQAFVFFGSDPEAGGDFVHSSAAVINPTYDDSNGTGDVALLFLDGDAPATPVQLARTVPAVGDQLDVVGFGLTENDEQTNSADSGIKRQVRATVDPPPEVPGWSPEYVTYSVSGCNGDSGGGDLIPDGTQVASVNSSITVFPCSASQMGSTPVAPYVDWMLSEAEQRGLELAVAAGDPDAGPIESDAGPGPDAGGGPTEEGSGGGCGCQTGGRELTLSPLILLGLLVIFRRRR